MGEEKNLLELIHLTGFFIYTLSSHLLADYPKTSATFFPISAGDSTT